MKKTKWFWLQLFAGEGAGASGGEGGEGTATGETGLAAGDQRLLELGVPAEKLRKRAKRASVSLPEGAVRTAPKEVQGQKPQEQVATAEENPTEEKTETPATKKSWEEIKKEYEEEYQKETQDMMKKRLKNVKESDEILAKITPALEVIARKYGVDVSDYDALAKAINDDDAYYEDKALEMGVPVETAKRIDQQDRDTARQARNLEQQKLLNHFMRMEQQGESLKKVFPNFDLRTELQNPVFARMTSPDIGLSVEDAYHAVHRKEIMQAGMQAAAQQTAQKMANAIQAGSLRPDENGTSGKSSSVTTFDYSKASKAQREALKAQIRAAAASGKKLYPGT